MIAIGILAIALMSIGDLNGGAWRMHLYAKRLTQAVQLSRAKMLDIQAQLRKDGVGDFSKSYHGDFDKEGAPDFKWEAEVVKAEIEVTPEQLMGAVSASMGLPQDSESSRGSDPQAANPLAMLGPAAGMVDGLLKQSVETLKQSVREVRLHVKWKDGNEEQDFTVVEHVVILPNAAQAAAAAATPMTPTTSAQPATGLTPAGINPGAMNPSSIPGLTPANPFAPGGGGGKP